MMSKRTQPSITSIVTTNNACEVTLSDDGKYIETLSITALAAQPGRVELVARTQLLTAKNPTETRVKSRTCLRVERLQALHETLGRFLAGEAASAREGINHVNQ
jgi:hypothetical protein